MPIVARFGSFWRRTSVDLLAITKDDYGTLDKRPPATRDKAAKNMIKRCTSEQLLLAVEHLSTICFGIKGAEFIRKGNGSFLAGLIKAYVDKNDGVQLARAYNIAGEEGLRSFKFSQPSTELFKLLWRLASARDDAHYVDYLPGNLSNKIWQPIILARTRRPVLEVVKTQLQMLANNEQLLKTILKLNIGDIEPVVEPSSEEVPHVVEPARKAVDFKVKLEQPRGRLQPLSTEDRFFAEIAVRRRLGNRVEQDPWQSEDLYQSKL